jgi:hypothetical protein
MEERVNRRSFLQKAAIGKKWLEATESQHCATAPKFGVIAVRNRDDKAQLLEAGRLWQRLHLEATLQGVAMRPLNHRISLRLCETTGQARAAARANEVIEGV